MTQVLFDGGRTSLRVLAVDRDISLLFVGNLASSSFPIIVFFVIFIFKFHYLYLEDRPKYIFEVIFCYALEDNCLEVFL